MIAVNSAIIREKQMRNKVEEQAIIYLSKRMFKEASLTVAAYEAEQVSPRGLGIDWKHHNPTDDAKILNAIFQEKPEILSKLDNAKLEPLQLAASMMFLWGDNKASKWLPPNFTTGLSMNNDSAARMLVFNARNKVTLNGYAESGVVRYVEILATKDSCESCKKSIGKRFELNEVPKLPNPNCTYKSGCRCVYLPCID
jgi:hypothetical protein